MLNPILQRLNPKMNQNSLIQKINMAKSFLNGKNPNVLYQEMMQNNKQFRDFSDHIQGKTLEDIAMEYDLDINLLKQFLN